MLVKITPENDREKQEPQRENAEGDAKIEAPPVPPGFQCRIGTAQGQIDIGARTHRQDPQNQDQICRQQRDRGNDFTGSILLPGVEGNERKPQACRDQKHRQQRTPADHHGTGLYRRHQLGNRLRAGNRQYQ